VKHSASPLYFGDVFDPSSCIVLELYISVCKLTYVHMIRGKKVFPHLFFTIDISIYCTIAAIFRLAKYL